MSVDHAAVQEAVENPPETRLARWERYVEAPLMVSAVIFLIAWSWPIVDPGLPRVWADALEVVCWIVWALVAIDYVGRLVLAKRKLPFVRSNLFDLLVVVLPILRPLRLLRLVALMSLINKSAASHMRGRVTSYAVGGSLLLIWCGGLSVLSVERGMPDSTINDLGDALWWGITTITTVGYGDKYPVTAEGRIIAGGMMVCGIALLGAVTATLASWLVGAVSGAEEDQSKVLLGEIGQLRQEIAELREFGDRRVSEGDRQPEQ